MYFYHRDETLPTYGEAHTPALNNHRRESLVQSYVLSQERADPSHGVALGVEIPYMDIHQAHIIFKNSRDWLLANGIK